MLKLYGVPLSQPWRAVAWALLQNRTPFEVVLAVPAAKNKSGTLHEDFLAKNPLATVPVIEEENGFTLAESPAILSYLAETRGWDAMYPSKDVQQRAKINAYMHWHHSNTRSISSIMAAYLRPDFGIEKEGPEMQQRQEKARQTLETLASAFLKDAPFLADATSPSIADILAYEEVVQTQSLGVLAFEPPPAVVAWTDRMKALPYHDVIHTALFALGDVNATNDTSLPKRMAQATKTALQALAKAQAV